jgi:hypothetical protein
VIEATENYPFEYWEGYANQLLHGVLPNSQLKRFTRNSALLGTYAEATIYTLLKNMLHPVRVSTGSLISPDLYSNEQASNSKPELKQLDAIAWDPNPFPPIFEEGDFALIPATSAVGVVEVKRSAYSNVGELMHSTLDWAEQHMIGASGWQGSAPRTVTVSPGTSMSQPMRSAYEPDQFHKAIGVGV